MVEVLAPAGGWEQLVAAARCGADAVYLGAGGFNARQNAENFGEGRLSEAVSYCHVRGLKVHVAVNTLVMDAELPRLDDTVDEIARAGADAVIIQDLGVAVRFHERVPYLQRHVSTQMTVHNLDGAKMAADLGFSRVVLARELTLKEIEHITARCDIETEVFIHGALCMCASGQCYLSSMLGGRSGNRGYCAQPCRLDFNNGERGHALSLKDMSHVKYARDLAEAGVTSFKIEGRMKRPEYVAAAVTAVRAALRGEPVDEETLRAVFSRSGFTDGYITGKRDITMFGYREKEDVTAAQGVLGRLAGLYRSERQSVPVNMSFKMTPDKTELTVNCEGESVTVTGDKPQSAVNRPTDAETARKSLEKTGGTPYFVKSFDAEVEPGLMAPAAALNALRREALEELTRRRGRPVPLKLLDPPISGISQYSTDGGKITEIWGRFDSIQQVPGEMSINRVILPIKEAEKSSNFVEKYGDMLIIELPALDFDGDGANLEFRLAALRDRGARAVICDNLYGVELGRRLNMSVYGGAGLNVMNTGALLELERSGLAAATVSFELGMSRIAALGGSIPRGIVAYGRLPLMRFRACPVRGKGGCGGCDSRRELTDRRGVKFPVICSERRYGTLLNSVPLHIAEKRLPKLDFLTLSFTTESPEEVKTVIEQYKNGVPSAAPRTGGLYYRQIQ